MQHIRSSMARRWWLLLPGLFTAGLAMVAACSDPPPPSPVPSTGGAGPGGANAGGNAAGGEGETGGSSASTNLTSSGNPAGGSGPCMSGDDEDKDMDGFSKNQGDCNDCDKNVNPSAIEVMTPKDGGAAIDEDCDGDKDEARSFCDEGLALDTFKAEDGAKAIDICDAPAKEGSGFGLLEAKYVRANGVDAATVAEQVGIKATFGDNVSARGGTRLLVLSTGKARVPGDADDQSSGCSDAFKATCKMANTASGGKPSGFPQAVDCATGMDACTMQPDVATQSIEDDIALQVKLRSPSNATGYQFDFDFYTFEFPEYVCSKFNDQFVTLVSPPPPGSPANFNGNISFDSKNNPVGVNVAFFDVCDKSVGGSSCAQGTAELLGTGFDTLNNCDQGWPILPCFKDPGGCTPLKNAGATGWLVTKAPVEGSSEVTLRFAIWDTGDQAYDSTVLIDRFTWIATPGKTVVNETQPVPK